MTDIKLAGNYIPGTGALGHLQLVHGSTELEVQAPWNIFFGHWVVGQEQPLTVPGDFSPENYSEKVVSFTKGAKPDDVWQLFLQMRDDVAAVTSSLPYELIFNSNSYINTLLTAVGVDTEEFLTYPDNVSQYPGVRSDAAKYWGVTYTITGTAGADVLVGGTGADEFIGGSGVDFLSGGKGNDILYADDSGPTVDGSGDYLTGGAGKDTFYVGNSLGQSKLFVWDGFIASLMYNQESRGTYDIIRDFSDQDTAYVTLTNSWYNMTNTPFSGYTLEDAGVSYGWKDAFYAHAGATSFTAVYDTYFDQNLGETITILIFFEPELYTPIFAVEVPNPVQGRTLTTAEEISGTGGDDTLIGTDVDDEISGGDGNDVIVGSGGNDVLNGGNGDDDFYTDDGEGADTYDGGSGTNSFIYEGSSNLTINAIAGTISTQVTHTYSNITIFYGATGNDFLIDNGGVRFFDGGVGSDAVALSNSMSNFRIYDGGSGYTIERAYIDRDAALDARYFRVENIEAITFSGTSVALQDMVVHEVVGTTGSDSLVGTIKSDLIDAGAGDDVIFGGIGSDIINGGSGINRADYDGYRVDYSIKLNADGTISIGSSTYGYDVLTNIQSVYFAAENAEYQIPQLFNTVPSDVTIFGTTGSDALTGTSGSDVLLGDSGNDVLEGGTSSDIYSFRAGDGNDTIEDWGDPIATDILRLETGVSPSSVTVERGSADIWDIVLGFGGGDSVTIKGGFFSGSSVIEEVRFADNTAWVVSDLRQLYLDQKSTAGSDTINGFIDANDLIHGKDGNDTIYAYSGNDTIYGDAGNDTIFGNEGDDTIVGGAGNDFIIGEVGSDLFVLNAGDGEDWIDDFEIGVDKIDLSAITSISNFSDVTATAAEWVTGSTWIYTSASNYVRLEGVSLASLQASDFIFA